MAGNLKQRLIKAGRDFNYAEGVKVLNSSGGEILADVVVYASGSSGPFITIAKADATTATKATGRLHITKHAIPDGGYGVVLPWKLVTGLNDDVATGGAGNEVYLAAAATGAMTLTKPSGGSTVVRAIGTVVTDATGAASGDGAVLFTNDAPVLE